MRLLIRLVLLAVLIPAAHAETFTVTRTDDPLPNTCVPGDCSLREAMEAAQANDPLAAADVIILPAGTYTLLRGRFDPIIQPLQVQGAGSDQTYIVLNETNAALFEVDSGGNLTLVGLGLAADGTEVRDCIDDDASISLDDVFGDSFTFCGTNTVRHSAILQSLYCNAGQTLVEDSSIREVTVQGSAASTLTLRRVSIDGAIDPNNPYESSTNLVRGSLIIEDSVITHTRIALQGIGPAVLSMRGSRYVDNLGPILTGVAETVLIEDSVFEDNTVRALYAAGGATWNVSGSSFVNNRVDGNAGGAIVLEDDTVLNIKNSTFSGNSFTPAAAANGARGAAIGYRNGAGAQLILNHVTIVPPAIMPAGVVGSAIGGHDNGVTVDISNSIVRGSCGMNAGVLANNAGNIESPGDTCALDAQSNLVSIPTADLALGTLGDHGGFTPTYLPGTGSVAIDHASTPQCQPTDQRGYARPGGVRCDVGAVEADAIDGIFVDGFEGN